MFTVHKDKIRKWLDLKNKKISIKEGFEQTYCSTADSYTDWLLMPGKECNSKHMRGVIRQWNQLLLAIYARTEPYQAEELSLWEMLEQIALELESQERKEEFRYELIGTKIPENENGILYSGERICQIADALREMGCVCLCGDSKKEQRAVAIAYARKYAERYETVVFATCEGGLQKTIIDDEKIQIADLKFSPVGKRGERGWYFKRKMKILSQIMNERTLMILDGVDEKKDKRMEEVRKLPCHVLFLCAGD